MVPRLVPPSMAMGPSFLARSLGLPFDARLMSCSLKAPALMSHRFMPQTSEMSIGAILPRKMEARNDETREMQDVLL